MKNSVNVTYFRDPDLPHMESCLVRQKPHVFPNHFHEHIFCIGMMERGSSYCVGDSQNIIGAGEICLINPGQVHSGVPIDKNGTAYRMLYMDAKWLMETASEMREGRDGFFEFDKIVLRDPFLYKSLRDVALCMENDSCKLERDSLIMEAFYHLLVRNGVVKPARRSKDREPGAIMKAREFLAEDLTAKISLEDAARVAGLSRHHFLRVFKKQTGVPPHVFRTLHRVELARQLMRQGMPFTEVALESGFSDQSHLVNKFRQFTGATPGQYVAGLG